jgi:hypothetical protein
VNKPLLTERYRASKNWRGKSGKISYFVINFRRIWNRGRRRWKNPFWIWRNSVFLKNPL